jgi:ribonuclease PH
MRQSGRQNDELRAYTFETGIMPYAEGSCLVRFGNTHVLCSASISDRVPPWMRGSNKGWVTAEYGMLPRSTHSRMRREAAAGKQSGRTQEIQRLIGRSLRAVTDLTALGERQIVLDCDVIQADGGTRTASICGAWVALKLACLGLVKEGVLKTDPVADMAAAISCGVVDDTPVLDLEYEEDSRAQTDANFVLSGSGGIIEVQATAEDKPLAFDDFDALMVLARKGCAEIFEAQKEAIAG